MKYLIYVLILAVLILCGCAEDDSLPQATLDCIETYSVENGYDFETIAFSPNTANVKVLTPEEAQAFCESQDGECCDASEIITSAAARCIAQTEGVGADGESMQVELHVRFFKMIWHVQWYTERDENQLGKHYDLYIEACTGRVLSKHETIVLS